MPAGRPVLGICGGLQMLGEALVDTHGVDGNAAGLGLLNLVTAFEPDKLLRAGTARFEPLAAPWQALSQLTPTGYEDPPWPHAAAQPRAARCRAAQP